MGSHPAVGRFRPTPGYFAAEPHKRCEARHYTNEADLRASHATAAGGEGASSVARPTGVSGGGAARRPRSAADFPHRWVARPARASGIPGECTGGGPGSSILRRLPAGWERGRAQHAARAAPQPQGEQAVVQAVADDPARRRMQKRMRHAGRRPGGSAQRAPPQTRAWRLRPRLRWPRKQRPRVPVRLALSLPTHPTPPPTAQVALPFQ